MQGLLEKYCGMHRVDADGREYRIHTREVVLEEGIGDRLGEVAGRYLGDVGKAVALVSDDNTHRVQGAAVEASLRAAGRTVTALRAAPTKGREVVVCDDDSIDDVTAWLSQSGAASAVAVGSGTINDLVKMSCHRVGIPWVGVATAPSNNGYTSAIAAILSKGVKITDPCTPAIAMYADPEVLRNAPYRMIASGIGDLYSKPVSNADWRLSTWLTGSFYSTIVMEIVEAGNALLLGVAPRLPARDLGAVKGLAEAIMLSGLAMQAAGSSSPASGGEHLVSHYLDMTEEIDHEPHDFHGCQVAVGTLVTARLYERALRLNPESIDIDMCVSRVLPWEDYAHVLAARFGALAPSVMAHAQKAYPSSTQLRERLVRLKSEWREKAPWIAETLRTPKDLEDELVSAECPVRFDQIGVSRPRAERAVLHCKDIRARYTILHLVWELGLLDPWGRDIVNRQFAAASA